ncbi:MAG: hypothetical protein AAF532_12025 [Planctomycetota bacterium]
MPDQATRRVPRGSYGRIVDLAIGLAAAGLAAAASGCGGGPPTEPVRKTAETVVTDQDVEAGSTIAAGGETSAPVEGDETEPTRPTGTEGLADASSTPAGPSIADVGVEDRLFAAWIALPMPTRDAARRAAAAVAEVATTCPEFAANCTRITVGLSPPAHPETVRAADDETASRDRDVVTARAELVAAFADLARAVAAMPDAATVQTVDLPEPARAVADSLLSLVPAGPHTQPVRAETARFYADLEIALGEATLARRQAEFDDAIGLFLVEAATAFDRPAEAAALMPRVRFRASRRAGGRDAAARTALFERIAVAVDRPDAAFVDAAVAADGALDVVCGPVADPDVFRERFESQTAGPGERAWRLSEIAAVAN